MCTGGEIRQSSWQNNVNQSLTYFLEILTASNGPHQQRNFYINLKKKSSEWCISMATEPTRPADEWCVMLWSDVSEIKNSAKFWF